MPSFNFLDVKKVQVKGFRPDDGPLQLFRITVVLKNGEDLLYQIHPTRNRARRAGRFLLLYVKILRERDEAREKIERLEDQLTETVAKNEQLQAIVDYRPGGDGYEQARDHFEREQDRRASSGGVL